MATLDWGMRLRVGGALVAGTVLGLVPAADAQPLRKDLASYFAFAMQSANLRDLNVNSACNSGVNCDMPSSNSSCGVITHGKSFYADGSQIAGDKANFTKGGANIFQIFTNDLNASSPFNIRQPGPNPNGTNSLSTPILGDLDGDGVPSCQTVGGSCQGDAGDLAVFCGMPSPFPACNPNGAGIEAQQGKDCVNGPDSQLGNGQCDLPPGTYNGITVKDKATLDLDGGTYAFCSFVGGKNLTITAGSATTLAVSGKFELNNSVVFGTACQDLNVFVNGGGNITFGRNSQINGFFCGPQSPISLGHSNVLTGRFVGDKIDADTSNNGFCCLGKCACFDTFTPTTAAVGATVTFSGGCDLSQVTAVRICGINAQIVTQSSSTLQVRVPAGAAGSCTVEADSGPGTFVAKQKLTVP